MLALNCCTRPCLKFVFCHKRVPWNTSGLSGGVMIGKNEAARPQPWAKKPQVVVGVASVLNGAKPEKLSDSARNGGFSHSPWSPWLQDASWNIPYPARSAVFWLPSTFHANPILGSKAVLSIWIPARASLCTQVVQPATIGPGTRYCPVKKLKSACRLFASVTGVTSDQASQRFKVRF